jgi:hypothetical protein
LHFRTVRCPDIDPSAVAINICDLAGNDVTHDPTSEAGSERFALVLQDYEPPKKEKVDGDKVPKVKLIYFPSARVGAKDKPFIDDVVSDLIHERK